MMTTMTKLVKSIPTNNKQLHKKLYFVFNFRSEKFATEKWPSNCQELRNLGHSLNGLYLVKDAKADATKIQTVYCAFQKSDPNGIRPITLFILFTIQIK